MQRHSIRYARFGIRLECSLAAPFDCPITDLAAALDHRIPRRGRHAAPQLPDESVVILIDTRPGPGVGADAADEMRTCHRQGLHDRRFAPSVRRRQCCDRFIEGNIQGLELAKIREFKRVDPEAVVCVLHVLSAPHCSIPSHGVK